MIKLIKYELKKELFLQKVILGMLAIFQIVFSLGLLSYSEDLLIIGYAFTVVTVFIVLFCIGIEEVAFYFDDLDPKHNELLFMLPCNTYQIVGAKIISMWIKTLIVSGGGLVTLLVDIAFLGLRKDQIWGFRKIAEVILGADPMRKTCQLIVILLGCFTFVYVGMFAITISTAYAKDKKSRAVFSGIIFLLLSLFVANMIWVMLDLVTHYHVYILPLKICIVISLIPKLLAFLGTCWFLKKASV